MYRRRRLTNALFYFFCYLALIIVASVVISVVVKLLVSGLSAFNLDLFTKMTPPPGSTGGLLNAIVGSLIMTVIAIVIAAPMGIFAAIYLSEFNRGQKIISVVRFINDVMLSAPSIIIGLFCYALFVAPVGHFSALAGAISIAIIALPIIVRTSEDMLSIVPSTLREAATALGAPYWRVVLKVVLPSIYHGIITGVLLAIARILGETAPLLFTALNNQFWNIDLTKATASLPIVIFQYAMSPYAGWQHLAWAGALLITLVIGVITLITRLILKPRSH